MGVVVVFLKKCFLTENWTVVKKLSSIIAKHDKCFLHWGGKCSISQLIRIQLHKTALTSCDMKHERLTHLRSFFFKSNILIEFKPPKPLTLITNSVSRLCKNFPENLFHKRGIFMTIGNCDEMKKEFAENFSQNPFFSKKAFVPKITLIKQSVWI